MKPNLVNTSLIDNYDRQEFVFFLISGSERTKMFTDRELRGGTIYDLISAPWTYFFQNSIPLDQAQLAEKTDQPLQMFRLIRVSCGAHDTLLVML